MTFVKANPAGWALFELLTSAQMNQIDDNLSYALDGRDGGTYAPTEILELDSPNLSIGVPVLKLHGTVDNSQYALLVELDQGSGHAIHVVNSQDVNQNMIVVDGTSVTTGTSTAMIINADDMTGGSAPAAIRAFGGDTSFATGTGGRGLQGVGGNGTVANSLGGNGVEGLAGNSNFVGMAVDTQGAYGVRGDGGNVVGDDPTHYAGFGFGGFGGDATVDGFGGFGLYGFGGLGPSSSSTGSDRGVGVAGRGRTGVRGVNNGVNAIRMASEFDDVARAGVQAAGKNHGIAFLSQFSGQADSSEANIMERVGSATGVGTNTVLRVRSAYNAGSFGNSDITYGIISAQESSSQHKFTNLFIGAGQPALSLSTSYAALVFPPALTLGINYLYGDEFVNGYGAMGFLRDGEVTGLLDETLFIGSGSGRQMYDRVVTSGDRAVPQAWGRFSPNGSGGVTLGTNYGVSSVAVTSFFGINALRITLDTIVGQPTVTNMIAFGTMNDIVGYIVHAFIEDATHIWLIAQLITTGAFLDLATQSCDLGLTVWGSLLYGSAADRPTYYRP